MFDFTVRGKKYRLRNPLAKEYKEADLIYSEVFSKALRDGVMTSDEMRKLIKDRNLISKEEQDTIDKLEQQIVELEKQLTNEKEKEKKVEIAKSLMNTRFLRNIALSKTYNMLHNTAETLANAEKTKWMVFKTLVTEENKPLFVDYDEFSNASNEVVVAGLRHFSYIDAGMDSISPNVEDKVLREIGYLDTEGYLLNAEGRIVNEEGKLIDRLFRLVDADGFLVDESGTFIDANGVKVEAEKKVKGSF